MLGKTISHYKILEKLGEGGMGVVYKAKDTKLKRTVALKFITPQGIESAEDKARFIHEAQAAASLSHPNICTIHEVDKADGRLFLAMEYVEGESLKERIARGPLKIDEALDVALQAVQGLDAAHRKSVVHRDVKPANIMIEAGGLVKIMDFGLAKLAGQTKLTRTGSTRGTAAYMSPEQASGAEVDARSDIFSLGVVLYEMLTGRLPFRGEYEQALIYQIMNGAPDSITSLRTGVPMDLERIVTKCLEKSRDERYQTAADLIADLRHLQRAIGAGTERTQRSVATAGRRVHRVRLWYWAVPVLLVAAIAAIIFVKMPSREAGQRQKSIAVLPFTNMSGDKEDEYFSDGITEDIITQLSNVAELKVISRTSTMQYKNTSKNLRDIARELNVATVLEGSVRRAGNQVRVVAQLIDAANDDHLWAQTYDEEMTQIFALQSDVARQIASALKAKLSPQEKEQIAKKPTESLDAYTYYLKGREYYYRYTKTDNEDAIGLFKKALELDHNYALAYAGLGDAYAQGEDRFGFPRVWTDSAIAVSSKAISIDPTLAEGYKALGLAYARKGWLGRSLEAYHKAVDINPNYYPALTNTAGIYLLRGKFDEALRWQNRSLLISPMSPVSYNILGLIYEQLGNDARALEYYTKALTLQPDLASAQIDLAYVYMEQGKYEQVIEQAKKILSSNPSDVRCLNLMGNAELMLADYSRAEECFAKTVAIDSLYGNTTRLGYVYWKTGRQNQAREMIARSLKHDMKELEQGNEGSEVPYDLAEIYAIQGNKAEAYKWLQKAIDAGWRDYRWGAADPLLENLRGDDKFKRTIADVKAMVDEMRKRVEETEKE